MREGEGEGKERLVHTVCPCTHSKHVYAHDVTALVGVVKVIDLIALTLSVKVNIDQGTLKCAEVWSQHLCCPSDIC